MDDKLFDLFDRVKSMRLRWPEKPVPQPMDTLTITELPKPVEQQTTWQPFIPGHQSNKGE